MRTRALPLHWVLRVLVVGGLAALLGGMWRIFLGTMLLGLVGGAVVVFSGKPKE